MTKAKWGYIFRKIIHFILNSCFAIAAILLPQDWVIPVTVSAFIIVTIVELVRLRTKAKKMVNEAFKPVLKREEKGRFSGIFWAAFAIALVAPITSQLALSYALVLFAISDPAAALVGKYTKSKKIHKNKTINGTVTFFLSALCVGVGYGYINGADSSFLAWAVLVAFVLSVVEVFTDPIDDNFSLVVIGALLINSIL